MTDESDKPEDMYGFTGGKQYTHPKTSKGNMQWIDQNDKIWLAIINDWDNCMSSQFKQVKIHCRNGISHSLRPIVWQLMSGSYLYRAKKEHYMAMDFLLSKEVDDHTTKDIQQDLHRCFPHNKLFKEKDGIGQESLFKILKAFTSYSPNTGYCQSFSSVAGFFLLQMPIVDAFYCFINLMDVYIPGYCDDKMVLVEIDCRVTMALLEKSCPIAYKHLSALQINPILWMTEWFSTMYIRTLPWSTLLRVWDIFLCEGVKVLFAVALTLMKIALGTKEKVDAAPSVYDCLQILTNIPMEYLEESIFIPMVLKSYVNGSKLAKEEKKQVFKYMMEQFKRGSKRAKNNHNNSAFTPLEKLSICRAPSKTPTLPPPQRQDASTDTAVDQTPALLARMPAAGNMDGNGVSGGVCGDVADEVDGDDVCGYDDSENIGNNIVDGECGDYKDSINEVAIENK